MKTIKKKFNIKDEKNNFKLTEVIVIALAVGLFLSLITGVIVYKVFSGTNSNTNDIIKTYNKILDVYYEDVDKDQLSDAAIDGMMDFLNEKYSIYLDEDGTKSLNSKLDGSYDGIGVSIGKYTEGVVIAAVYDNTPAAEAGLKVGDIILSVDGTDISNMELTEVSSLIKDKESTTLVIKRDNEELTFDINIKTLDTPVVSYQIFEKNDKKIGYIYLASFSNGSYKQVRTAVEKMENEGIDSLIFDVRSNTGGYLTSVTDILSMFNKKGKILYSLEEKNSKTTYVDETDEERSYPIVVLEDGISASASEVLISALKESYGAIVVGQTSYGKGKVQQTTTLSDDTMVKYTTAKWYTPNGNSIDEVGIKPGISVELSDEYEENPSDDTDDQLQKALEILANK